jgi:parallel beta-helix repeat protein
MRKMTLRTRICVGVFIALIACQPVILMLSISSGTVGYSPTKRGVFAQTPGSRLDPGDYTSHVPIFIDGTSDFAAQGYPGSGTAGDPYVIAGLNITADASMDCIEVFNTTAYFVIRDCYINQMSVSMGVPYSGIRLLDTTQGTIEYCTIISEDRGIYLTNANNTLVTHTASNGGVQMALYGEGLYQTTYTWNRFESAEHRAMRIDDGDYCTITNSEFYNYDIGGWYCTAFFDVNHTVIDNCEMYCDDGAAGISIDTDYYSSISNTLIWAPGTIALQVFGCPNVTLTNLTISEASLGAELVFSPGMEFTESTISDTSSNGVFMLASDNSSLDNVDITNTGNHGMEVIDCGDTTITDCTISDAASVGLLCSASSDMLFESLLIQNTGAEGLILGDSHRALISDCSFGPSIGGNGIESQTSHNGTLIDSSVEDTLFHGLYSDSSDNWTVTGNTFSDISQIGIYHYQGANMIVTGNTISDLPNDYGIDLDSCPDSTISSNTVSGSTDMGIYVTGSVRSTIDSNNIFDCEGGISCDTSENTTIVGNTVDVEETGISVIDFDGAYVANNLVSNAIYGIVTGLLLDATFESNTLTDCGFFLGSTEPITSYEYNMTGNTVNTEPVYFGLHETSGSISSGSYGQVILVNCSNIDVGFGGIMPHDPATALFQIHHCDNISISGVNALGHAFGFNIANSANITINGVQCIGLGYDRTSYGVAAYNTDDIVIMNSYFADSYATGGFGVLTFSSCIDVDILDCTVQRGYRGMFFDDTANVTVLDCDVLHNEYSGIQFWDNLCEYQHIEQNYIYNNTRGLYGDRASEWFIKNNTITQNSLYGLFIGAEIGDNGNITLNTLESNGDGIYINGGDFYYIYNNTIRWNKNIGILLAGSSGTEVFYNIIALSGTDNGVDNADFNFWDDGSILGNSWDDWDSTGVYEIDSLTIDRWPMLYLPTEPIIDQPLDISYAEFSTGNTITWNPFDDSLRDWELEIDGVLFDSDIWNFVDITVNVDGLAYGTHTAVLTVWDVNQNSVSDTVLIHVFDDIVPTISSESDMIVFLDGSGQSVTWTADDLHPDDFQFIIDDVVVDSGSWTSGPITGSLDGLALGDHIVRMVVFDLDGNSVYDAIVVRVVDDDTPPVIDSPDDITYVEGFTQNFIVWSASDDYPDSYSVVYNGSVYESGDWSGAAILVNVDGLLAGNHSFRITVYDGVGLSAQDTVVVIVTPPEGVTTLPPPADLTALIIIGGVAAGVVIIVVIVYFLKQRGGYKP